MLDVAVIGAGAIAQKAYLPAVSELSTARIHTVVDADATRARSVASTFAAEHHATADQDVSAEIDAAIITTPPRFHADIAERFLAKGVHVLTEKPVATDHERGQEIVELAAAEDLHYAISRQMRESPACRTLRTFCQKSAIGDPSAVRMRYGDETNWEFASDYRLRKDLAWGGVLTDKAPHALDLLLWIFGPDADITTYRDDSFGGLEANAEIELSWPDGVTASLEVAADRDIRNYIRVAGEDGVLRADPKADSAALQEPNGEETILRPRDRDTFGDYLPRVGKQLDRFLRAVDGDSATYVPASDGVDLLEWIESCYAQREALEHPWEQRPLRTAELEV